MLNIEANPDLLEWGDKIGAGGFKDVYNGFYGENKEEVAILVLRTSSSSDNHHKVFRKELRVLSKMSYHPSFPNFYGFCKTKDHQICLVNELCDCTLNDGISKTIKFFDKEKRSKQCLGIVVDILRGLLLMHQQGISHCDLKPENILLKKFEDKTNGEEMFMAKLTDFGLSRDENSKFSKQVQGHAFYAPPDVETTTCEADIYAFGCLCVFIFSGAHPWQSQYDLRRGPDLFRRKVRLNYEDVFLPKEELDSIDDPLIKDLIAKCLSVNPESRPSVSKMLTSILQMKQGEFVDVYHTGFQNLANMHDLFAQKYVSIDRVIEKQNLQSEQLAFFD
jgi:serine/threonine protein kinase